MSDRNYMAHRMNVLRTLAGSPHEAYTKVTHPYTDLTSYRANVGYVGHSYQQFSGHSLYEIITVTGGERNLIEGVSRSAILAFIDGCIMGMEGKVSHYGTVS